MRVPDAERLLDAWNQGRRLTPTERALSLLVLAWPEMPREKLAALPLGARDARLAALRAQLFGPLAEALVTCPACRAQLEFPVNFERLYQGEREEVRKEEIIAGGYRVRFRPPTSADMLAIAGMPPEQGAKMLLGRCVEVVEGADSPDDLPEMVRAAIEQAMEEADPGANVQFGLHCPDCGHTWQATLDLVGFLWQELDAWARRVLWEVHTLALAYGWSEHEILTLTPWRRRIYLEWIES